MLPLSHTHINHTLTLLFFKHICLAWPANQEDPPIITKSYNFWVGDYSSLTCFWIAAGYLVRCQAEKPLSANFRGAHEVKGNGRRSCPLCLPPNDSWLPFSLSGSVPFDGIGSLLWVGFGLGFGSFGSSSIDRSQVLCKPAPLIGIWMMGTHAARSWCIAKNDWHKCF